MKTFMKTILGTILGTILIIILLLITTSVYANECIVNKKTNIVKEWTTGVYCDTPPMNIDEELKTFKTIPGYGKVLKYENGDIVSTNEDLPIINHHVERLKKLLKNNEIKEEIKKIKNTP